MNKSADPRQVLHLVGHIPKTGGQSLRHHFVQHLTFHETAIHLGPVGRIAEQDLGLTPFEERSVADRQRARVIFGHEVTLDTHRLVPERTHRYSIFLRSPASRLVSLYNFRMHNDLERSGTPPVPFDVWYGGQSRNGMCRKIVRHFGGIRSKMSDSALYDTSMQLLEGIWLVGHLEAFDSDTRILMDDLGLPPLTLIANVTGRDFPERVPLTPGLKERLDSDHPYDKRLSDEWLARSRARAS